MRTGAAEGPARKDSIARIDTGIVQATDTPEMKDAFMKRRLETQTGTPGQFGSFVGKQIGQNAKAAKSRVSGTE